MTIAEYMLTKKKMASEDQQNFINNILNVAKTGADIYGAVQEGQKYKPGSDYMNAQKQGIDWQTGAEQQRGDYQFGLQTKLADYDQKIAEAQAAGDQQRAMELAREKNRLDMELQGLQNKGTFNVANIKAIGERPKIKDVLDDLTTLNPDWVVMDATGQPRLNIQQYGNAIRDGVLAYYTRPEDRAWASKILQSTLGSYKPGATVPTASNAPSQPADANQITNNLMATGMLGSVEAATLGPLISSALSMASGAILPVGIAEAISRIIFKQSLIGKVPAIRNWVNKIRPGLGDQLFPASMYSSQAIKGVQGAAQRASGGVALPK